MKREESNTLGKVIAQHFAERKETNPSYSLRAYARDLKLSHSTIHALLIGKAPGSQKLIEKIAKKIGLSESEKKYFIYTSQLKTIRDPLKKANLFQKAIVLNTRFNTLSTEEYHLISKWYNYAVMELIKTRDASLDPKWIAKKLGITQVEAETSLQMLQKLGVIEIQNGQLVIKRDYIELPADKISFGPARNLLRTMVEKCLSIFDSQTKEVRSFSNTVLRFRKSDMEEVHEYIAKFRREFSQKFESGTHHDSVYSLNVNFFRLDKDEIEKE